MLRVKRVYEPASDEDGERVLIDRLWPRGISRESARVDRWLKELAPSDALRRWFGHEPAKFPEFRERYRRELEREGPVLRELAARSRSGNVTLLYAARDRAHSNAAVLEELLRGLS